MTDKILYITGLNPFAMLVRNDKDVLCLLEEVKLNDKCDYEEPVVAINVLMNMYDLKDEDLIEIDKFPNITAKSKYLGLEYNKEFCFGAIRSNSLYYELFKHPYCKPKEFFERVSYMINQGLKVGWFQGKHRTANGVDLNRCIITKSDTEFDELISKKDINEATLFNRVIEAHGNTKLFLNMLDAYNPNQAIEKLKNNEIDVLVMHNCICYLTSKKGEIDG